MRECPRCKKETFKDWCTDCNVETSPCKCETIETDRNKYFGYCCGDYVVTVYVDYCPDCGRVFNVYK